MKGFSEVAWDSVAAEFEAITSHPFVVALTDGSLETAVFARYLHDDAHYLTAYARVLALTGSRMPTPDGIALLASSAASAITAERSLHAGFLRPLGIDPEAGDPTPTCQAYTGFLTQQAAAAPVEVALAAVLPCFRVYAEVGSAIVRSVQLDGHPYATWIEAYGDPEFAQSVRAVEALCDDAALGSAHRDAMLSAYGAATRYEWAFWDAAWRGERPPLT